MNEGPAVPWSSGIQSGRLNKKIVLHKPTRLSFSRQTYKLKIPLTTNFSESLQHVVTGSQPIFAQQNLYRIKGRDSADFWYSRIIYQNTGQCYKMNCKIAHGRRVPIGRANITFFRLGFLSFVAPYISASSLIRSPSSSFWHSGTATLNFQSVSPSNWPVRMKHIPDESEMCNKIISTRTLWSFSKSTRSPTRSDEEGTERVLACISRLPGLFGDKVGIW